MHVEDEVSVPDFGTCTQIMCVLDEKHSEQSVLDALKKHSEGFLEEVGVTTFSSVLMFNCSSTELVDKVVNELARYGLEKSED